MNNNALRVGNAYPQGHRIHSSDASATHLIAPVVDANRMETTHSDVSCDRGGSTRTRSDIKSK